MKIISCAGYYDTGSSAVNDYFSEFDNVRVLDSTEFKFLQDCDGVAALEMNLIEHPHRHNTSHAIKRFIKASKFENGNIFFKRYRKVWGDKYMQFTNEYVNEITDLQTVSFWRGDAIERGEFFYILDALVSVISKKINKRYLTSILSLRKEMGFFTSITREDFYAATKRYTSKLFNYVGGDSDFLIVDQLVPPSEISKYMNYVDNLSVIVVDRDPRDVYLIDLQCPYWRKIPYKVEDFCQWYRIIREHRKKDEHCDNAIFINFEDLVYDYNNTTQKLREFIGINEDLHKCPLCHFNPNVSIKNTRLWERYINNEYEVKYIEDNLAEYLYNY